MHDDGSPRNGSEEQPLIEQDPTVFYAPGTDTAGTESDQRVAGAFRYALVVESGPTAGLAYVLGEGDTVAGRRDGSDIFLGDVTVSRDHARFTVDGEGLTVTDAGSTNGTYVNMERVVTASLKPGDEVIIGKFHLRVTSGSAAA